MSFSINGWDSGDIVVYGIKEELDSVNVNTLTWNTAPGVKNNPTPALDSPVELDLDDLVDPLMTCQSVRRTRQSTETSQELADFLNSDIDGIVIFLFAPAEVGDAGIIEAIEETPVGEHGTLLEGDFEKILGFATNPKPDNGALDVYHDVVLSWTTEGYAVKYDVYLGTKFDDVNSASTTVDSNGVYQVGRTRTSIRPSEPFDFKSVRPTTGASTESERRPVTRYTEAKSGNLLSSLIPLQLTELLSPRVLPVVLRVKGLKILSMAPDWTKPACCTEISAKARCG